MNAIFAVNSLDGFGSGVDMPWPRNTQDLRRFREITTGHTVVMGGGTWNSNIPKPLPNRRNCVLSTSIVDTRCEVYSNVTDLLMHLKKDEQVFVIGGARILWIMRDYIKRVYLTRIQDFTTCDIILDTVKYLQGFDLQESTAHDNHTFEIYTRKM